MAIAALIAALAAFALLAVAALACLTPLRLDIRIRKARDWDTRFELRPFAGLGPRIPLRRKHREAPASKTTSKRRAPSSRVLGAGLAFLREVLTCIRLDALRGHVRFGCGDPAETGQVFGAVMPALHAARALPRLRLDVQPDFEAEVLRGEVSLVLSLVPARLLVPLARFGWRVFRP